MYQDASSAALSHTDSGFAGPAASAPVRQRPRGLTWRHAATGGLLLVVLPVFAVAALVCLPVLLVATAAQSLWRVGALTRSAPHTRGAAPTPSL